MKGTIIAIPRRYFCDADDLRVRELDEDDLLSEDFVARRFVGIDMFMQRPTKSMVYFEYGTF